MIGVSLYAGFNNNPILYNDPLGDTSAPSFGVRAFGALKGVGGLFEMGIGAAGGAATSWTGVGGLLGGMAVVHGADVSSHGFEEMWTGVESPSYTNRLVNKGLQSVGVSPDKSSLSAEFIDMSLSIMLSGGAGGARDGTRLAPKLLIPPKISGLPVATKGFSASGKFPLAFKPAAAVEIQNGCEAVAMAVHKSIGGQFLQVINPVKGLSLGPANYAGGSVSSWFHHVAVINEGIVYDKMTGAAGMALDEYKKIFEYADDLLFQVVPQITVK